MQEFLHTNSDDVQEDIERYRKMVTNDKELYFDVHQIENIFEFYLEKDMFEEAEKILQIGLRQHPNATSLLLKKATSLSDKDKVEEAMMILNKLAKIEHSNPDVFLLLGWNHLKKSNVKKAVENFNIAISAAFEDEEDILFEVGFNLSQEGLYKEALPYLERSDKKFPSNENVLFELAFIYDKLGKTEQSIECYDKLLDINPFSENAWYNLGILHSKNDNFTKAVQAYEFTLTINPYHSEAYFNLGNSFAHSGLFDKALKAYHQHASLSNDVILTYQYIADCWEQLGNYDMAIRFYLLVTKKNKENPDAWYGLGSAFMGKGDFKSALQSLDQAISMEPLSPDYWFAHARCLYELNKNEDAVKSLENGLNIDPAETTAWIELFRLRLITEPLFEPTKFIAELLNNFKDSSAIHYLATFVFLKHFKDEESAAVHLSRALELNADGLNVLLNEYPVISDNERLTSIIMEAKASN